MGIDGLDWTVKMNVNIACEEDVSFDNGLVGGYCTRCFRPLWLSSSFGCRLALWMRRVFARALPLAAM
jgi:hypothetical protein